MSSDPIHAVTGAYGYSGKYIAQRLLNDRQTVITLTNSLSRPNSFGDRVKAFPFHFDHPELLAEHLKASRFCTTPTGCDSITACSSTPMPCRTPSLSSRRPEKQVSSESST